MEPRRLDLRSALAGVGATLALVLCLGLVPVRSAPVQSDVGRYQAEVGSSLSALVIIDTVDGKGWRVHYHRESEQWSYELMGPGPNPKKE